MTEAESIQNDNLMARWRLAQATAHRFLLVLEDDTDAINGLSIQSLCSQSGDRHAVIRGHACAMDRADRVDMLLGREYDALIFDSRRRFDPALLAAAAGTVRGGGLLVWLISLRTDPSRSTTPFLARLLRRLEQHVAALPDHPRVRTSRHAGTVPILDPRRATLAATWRDEQDALLERLLALYGASNTDVLIVQGERGRGKSALLGRFVHQLAIQGANPLIAASRPSQLYTVCKHAMDNSYADRTRPLRVLGIDQALEAPPDTLILDEAAAVPLPLLARLATRHARLVVATTVKGYEGAGRGFALRFTRELDRLGKRWQRVVPRLPVRWGIGDPLEACLNDLLLLDLDVEDEPPHPSVGADPLQHLVVYRLDRLRLSRDERLLRRIVGILLQAHYQTTPRDVAHMLDEPSLEVWAAGTGDTLAAAEADHVAGVVLLSFEGPLPKAQHEDILSRKRRPKHALLPQLLAQCAATAAPLNWCHARIVRIAVRPSLQRQGIGSMLLNEIGHQMIGRVALIGASFGEDAVTAKFWRANGYTAVHRGYRRNARSGLRSVMMARPLTEDSALLIASAHALFDDNQRALKSQPDRVPPQERPSDQTILGLFARGDRSLVDSAGALRRYAGSASAAASRMSTSCSTGSTAEPEWLARLFARVAPTAKGRRSREHALRRWLLTDMKR